MLAVLVMRKLPSDGFFQQTDNMSLVKWLRNVMISDDPKRAIDEKLLGNGYEEQMLLVLKIACFCTVDNPKERPNSIDVRSEIRFTIEAYAIKVLISNAVIEKHCHNRNKIKFIPRSSYSRHIHFFRVIQKGDKKQEDSKKIEEKLTWGSSAPDKLKNRTNKLLAHSIIRNQPQEYTESHFGEGYGENLFNLDKSNGTWHGDKGICSPWFSALLLWVFHSTGKKLTGISRTNVIILLT
ncbi:hypothetical protein NE237_007662 [Protea cynaroides]|uniref:Uncharacterized protein n=1 Tax=Protea cynaroides TaxID=273540 RepID=A0A9Q0QWF0_9MAGN|nr:hypothetical protein NE237_007662 [Protea cynaroides]